MDKHKSKESIFSLRKIKNVLSIILILSFALITLSACNGIIDDLVSRPGHTLVVVDPDDPDTDDEYVYIEEEFVPSREEAEIYTGFYSPLTGLPTWEDVSNRRPIAIMINNVRQGLPQVGTSRADVIYETLVEGGLTRTVALFSDYASAGTIGGVRSTRQGFVDIAQAHDAILMHAGGSPDALSLIRNRSLDAINEIGGPRGRNIFFRDAGRRSQLGSEHSLMTSGERIANEIDTFGFRLEHRDNFEQPFQFVEDGTPAGGADANRVVVTFSAAKSTTFVYDSNTGRYYIEQFDRAHIDAGNNTQLSVTNVIVIRTTIVGIPGDDAGRQRTTTEGSGTGYFINGGRVVEINWRRDSLNDPFTFTLADGSPLFLGIGRSYICIIPTNQTVNFS